MISRTPNVVELYLSPPSNGVPKIKPLKDQKRRKQGEKNNVDNT